MQDNNRPGVEGGPDSLQCFGIDTSLLMLALLLFFSSIVLNFIIYEFSPLGYNNVTILHSWDVLNLRNIYNDSWGVMGRALDYLLENRPLGDKTPVYSQIFFNSGRKFQYPLSALIPFYIVRDHLDLVSAIFFLAMIAALVLLFEVSWRQCGLAIGGTRSMVLRATLVVFAAFTFYPLVKAFTLGQIQVWLNSLFAISLLFWLLERKAISGVLLGLFILVKPHFGLFIAWGLVRREWRFVIASSGVCVAGLAASFMVFGWQNNINYIRVLSFLSANPESFYPNNSIGGLLNRFVGMGRPDLYDNIHSDLFFPPYSAWIHAVSTITAALILIPAILVRLGPKDTRGVYGFCIMAVSCVVASPIAWEHHYGVLLPVFIVIYTRVLMGGGRGLIVLAILYIFASNHLQVLNLLADTPLNVLQTYLWFSGLGLLGFLYGWLPVNNGQEFRVYDAKSSR